MTLLIVYLLVALVFSFLCSIAEAVLLSVTSAHVALLEAHGKPAGPLLRRMKSNINQPLAAILTLNTIAHTVGAAGAGAQVTVVFGSAWLGIGSVILTLLILFLSEIIPKTLGALHWRRLAPATAYGLRILIWMLYPFVKLTEKMTGGLAGEPTLAGFSREEFSAMAELSAKEGQLAERESEVLKNLMLLRDTDVRNAMTPRPVVFSLPKDSSVDAFFEEFEHVRFSRIPVYGQDPDQIDGFVLRSDLLLARASGEGWSRLRKFERPITALPETLSLSKAFNHVLRERAHIVQIVDEYGVLAGILTMEDIIETLLGLEIVDESDENVDMQEHARHLWRRRARDMGIDPTSTEQL
jgi:CBS domain containing-hemolysin-like protein